MTVEQQYGVSGLFTNPNPQGKVPPGAMLRAEEVVYRRPGMAEPRPGFQASPAISLESLYGILPYDTSAIFVGPTVVDGSSTYGGASGTTAVYDGNQTTPAPAALQWYRDAIRAVESRRNLYLSTKDGIRLMTSPSDAAALQAGAIPPNIFEAVLVTGGSFLPTGSKVSYRLVYKRIDPNGLESMSAPSGQFIVANTSGGDRGVQLTWSWRGRSGYRATDVIQVYRSETVDSSIDPDDVHFLVAEIKVDGTADVTGTSGSGTFTDRTTSADAITSLGAALYTNGTATDGGAAASNIRPPAAADLALYQGSLFWSGLTDYARKTLRWEATSNLGSSAADGVGYRQRNGTRTNGSAVISGLSSVTGLKVGMILSSTTGWTASPFVPVRIVAIVGSDLTMSTTWGGSTDGAPVTLTFCDSICIGDPSDGGSYYRADFAHYLIEGVNRLLLSDHGRCATNATAFAYAVGVVASPQLSRSYTVTIEAFSALDSFQLSATHGSEYNPPIPEPSATPDTVAPDGIGNGVGWSQRDLPEHRQLVDIVRVGKATSPVLRILATRDAVWILKHRGDGIYRLSGMGAETGFRLDQMDTSTYLLHPNLACVLDDMIYAWTNKGLCAISDDGVIPISQPVIGDDTRTLEMALDAVSGYEHASFAVANAKDGEVIFGLPDPSREDDAGAVTRVYVYNTRSRGFSRWFVGQEATKTCAVYDQNTRLLGFGTSDSGALLSEREPNAIVVNADAEFSLTIDDITDNVVTLDGAVSGWTPAEGDIVRTGTGFAVITAAASSTEFTVNDAGDLAVGAGASYQAFTSRLSWLPKVGPGGAGKKRFMSMTVHWDDTRGMYAWTVKASGSNTGAAQDSLSYTRSYQRSAEKRDDTRALFTRAVALNNQLYPSLEITQADARWRLSGMTLFYNVTNARASR